MQIKRLSVGDETLAGEVARTFKNASVAGADMHGFLANDGNYLIAAYDGAILAGFILGYELQRLDGSRPMMFLYEIEVSAACRRGIGQALVKKLKWLAQARRCRKMFVLTNESNAAAVGLYQATGGIRALEDEALFEYKID